jgi:hypothetical protein
VIYDRAPRVYVVDLESMSSDELAARHLVVHLPTQVMLRRSIFRFVSRIVELQGFDSLHDTGQEYLYVDAG